jgi:hypothetical protein
MSLFECELKKEVDRDVTDSAIWSRGVVDVRLGLDC